MKSFVLSLFLLTALQSAATDIELIMGRQIRRTPAPLPEIDPSAFPDMQAAAIAGDPVAQQKLPQLSIQHIRAVYAALAQNQSLLFSERKTNRDMLKPSMQNYALNIKGFFKKTTRTIEVEKSDLQIKTTAGQSFTIKRLDLDLETGFVQVEPTEENPTTEISLDSLPEKDQRFILSAWEDELFASSDFSIDFEDEEFEQVGVRGRRGIYIREDERQQKLTVMNDGDVPLTHLVLEYQFFYDQTLMGYSRDLPDEYRFVGYIEIPSLEPGKQLELNLELPNIVQMSPVTFQGRQGFDNNINLPPNTNNSGKGSFEGLWVRVSRFTPYGERLEKGFEDSGVPPRSWAGVLPLSTRFD